MSGERKSALDVREIIRRLREGQAARGIAREMDLSRNTVLKYRDWAHREGFLRCDALPPPGEIHARLQRLDVPRFPGPVSSVEPYRDFVIQKRSEGVEIRALHALLREKGFRGGYSSVRRFVGRLEEKKPEVFVRVETAPGEEAQVDFGYAGELYDEESSRMRKAWVFVMTLSWSRHMYAELVFDQKVETWIELHLRAFEHFGGCVKRVVIDNLKAGISRCVIHDAEAQRSYRDFAEHYGFLISPCRPRTPQHKGKVESGVHYVKRNALAGRRFRSLQEANEHLQRWIVETAGVRDHGTTHERPLDRFERERDFLSELPPQRFETAVWRRVKVHTDCHVIFDYSYYSVPHRLVGEKLWLRATSHRVELYLNYERITSHARAKRRGQWVTSFDHLPPQKVEGLYPRAVEIRARAHKIGRWTAELIDRLLGDRPMDRVRGAQGILKLSRRHGSKRLERACQRALSFDEVQYRTVRRILEKGLDAECIPGEREEGVCLPRTSLHARPVAEILSLS